MDHTTNSCTRGFTVVVTADGTTQQARYRFRERAVIGRGADCDIRLLDSRISRRHASLTLRDACVTVADMGSRNGTEVGGRRLHGAEALVGTGGIARIVSTTFQIHVGDDEEAETVPVDRRVLRRVLLDERGAAIQIDGCYVDVSMSPREFRLLETLASTAPRAVPTADLGDAIWGAEEWDRHMLHNVISHARRKLRSASGVQDSLIITVPRLGYRLA